MSKLLTVCLLIVASAAASAITIVDNSRSDYSIVLPHEATPAEIFAAEELSGHIGQMCQIDLNIIRDSDPLPKHAILLGNTKHLKQLGVAPDWAEIGKEGYLLRTMGDYLIVAGGRPRGTLYGVYALLEDYWGCRWFAPDTSFIPKRQTLDVPDVDIVVKPAFEYRDPWMYAGGSRNLWWRDHFVPEYVARTRNSGNLINEHVHPIGNGEGGYFKISHCYHNFSLLVPAKDYAEKHPEYYALYEGNREATGDLELCLTNPDVARIAAKTLARWMRAEPDADMFFIGQSDSSRYCRCDKCEVARARYGGWDGVRRVSIPGNLPEDTWNDYGGKAGLNLEFVNKIASMLEKESPDKRIGTYAYWYTRRPPKGIKAHKNVVIWYCPIERCQSHSLDGCPVNNEFHNFASEITSWRQIARQVYAYDYWMVDALGQPFDIFTLKDTVRLYQKLGVDGVEVDAVGDLPAGFGFLRYWFWSELLRDPDFDFERGISEFLSAYYGAAGPHLRQYLELISKSDSYEPISTEQTGPTRRPYKPLKLEQLQGCGLERRKLSRETIDKGYVLFQQALKAVADDPKSLGHVQAARMVLQYAMLEWLPKDDPRLKDEAVSLFREAEKLEMPYIQCKPMEQYRKELSDRLGVELVVR